MDRKKVISALQDFLGKPEAKPRKISMVLTDDCVVGIIADSEESKYLLGNFNKYENEKQRKPPKLKYDTWCKYDLKYLEKAIKLLKACGEDAVIIRMNHEECTTGEQVYPIELAGGDDTFKIIIAPRWKGGKK